MGSFVNYLALLYTTVAMTTSENEYLITFLKEIRGRYATTAATTTVRWRSVEAASFHFWRKVCAAFYSSSFLFLFFASLLLLPFSPLCPFNKEHYILGYEAVSKAAKRRHATPPPRHAKLRRRRRALRTATRDAVRTAPSRTTPLRNEAYMARYKNNIY